MTANILSNEPSGSIVAFEGHPETISTQLRLLPTSPQLLVLPGIQCYLPASSSDVDSDANFEADVFIRKTHEAVAARNEAARAFLQPPANTSKRLVFLNGGTPTAQALCVREIMKHETNGDHVKAEAKFSFLIREGLGGLSMQLKKWQESEASSLAAPRTATVAPEGRRNGQDVPASSRRSPLERIEEDPITRAMRAAEALDRQTANLQPSNDLDLTLSSRPRSASLPMYGYSDNYGDAAPFYVFGGSNRRRANSDASVEEAVDDVLTPQPDTAPNFAVIHYDDLGEKSPLLSSVEASRSPSCAGETYGPTFLHSPHAEALFTSKSDVFDPRSPSDVVFGEASLVDMRVPAGKGPVLRVRSLDRICPSTSSYRDAPFVSEADDEELGERLPIRPRSCMVIADEKDRASGRLNLIERPRTIMVKARHLSIVNLAPVPASKKRKPIHDTYVDRGTDADVMEENVEPFTPVFPVTEDLVVYLRENIPDALLDSVIRGFKDGSYPVLCQSSDCSETDTVDDQLPSTPKSSSIKDGEITPRATVSKEPMVVSPSKDVDDYDPFAYVQSSWPPKRPTSATESQKKPLAKVDAPPTPEKTPVPSVSDPEEKFHEILITDSPTAVTIQNSLRSVLNIYFPPDTDGYHQFQFSFLPELEGLWKPVFREAEPGSPRPNNHRMDQILAIGSQHGVKREYSSNVVGLLSKLGFKSSGMCRSGRLDFRYLLANAMQVFTAQPLTNQASDNPFSNPYLLATLIVPHLETYLALHSEVRYLLLEYPPEHLSTVLALQKLVGVDLMKVAQIVDDKSGDLGAFKHIRGASLTKNTEKSSPLGRPVCSDISVAKANFLLTSSADETEILTFLAAIRKILLGVSEYYHSEEPPRTATQAQIPSVQKTRPPPILTSRFSAFPKSTGLQSPITPAAADSLASPMPSRPPSIAETVKTMKSARTGRSRKSRRRPPTADGAESMMTYDPAEDSDYDFEERRLMPIFLPKPSRRPKPNSRKALKFLGLA